MPSCKTIEYAPTPLSCRCSMSAWVQGSHRNRPGNQVCASCSSVCSCPLSLSLLRIRMAIQVIICLFFVAGVIRYVLVSRRRFRMTTESSICCPLVALRSTVLQWHLIHRTSALPSSVPLRCTPRISFLAVPVVSLCGSAHQLWLSTELACRQHRYMALSLAYKKEKHR